MPGRIYEGERDDIGHDIRRRMFVECRCDLVEKGGCSCDDDGMPSHHGTWREEFDHGNYIGGSERTKHGFSSVDGSEATRYR